MSGAHAEPHEFDLTALRARIEGDRRYKGLFAAIKIAEAHRAVEIDLRQAWNALELLSRTIPQPQADGIDQDSDSALITQALMTNAVMLYCRALVSRAASGRYTVGATANYTAEQRAWHKQIVHLRDKVLAHHGEGGGLEIGPWMRARLLASATGIDFQFQITNARAETANALSSLLVSALEWLDGERQLWIERIGDELSLLLPSDEHFTSLLTQCVFVHERNFVGPRPQRDSFQSRVVEAKDGRLPKA